MSNEENSHQNMFLKNPTEKILKDYELCIINGIVYYKHQF